MKQPELIVMLTYHDRTVPDAYALFDQAKECPVQYWGFKEDGLPLPQMKELFSYMKKWGKTTVLEVVAYTEEECLTGAKMAAECECDILMGTLYYDSVRDFCQEHHLKYMPFIGRVSGRPSLLEGTAEELIAEAEECLKKGVWGFDLLGYRHQDNPAALIRTFIEAVDAPVCVAGNVDSFERLQEVLDMKPWGFTIGGGFFKHRFGESFPEQVEAVMDYITAEEYQYV
jgi:hypothetical protein